MLQQMYRVFEGMSMSKLITTLIAMSIKEYFHTFLCPVLWRFDHVTLSKSNENNASSL